MSSTSPTRRSFLARGAVLASVPAIATLAGGVLAEPASADTLPDYAPVPPSALGPALNAQGYFVGRVEKNLYWVTDGTYQAAPSKSSSMTSPRPTGRIPSAGNHPP
jgi:hypothetical protein